MLYTISDALFVFNMPLKQIVRKKVARQLEILDSLLLVPYEVVILPYDAKTKFRARLYDDPVINLLCPEEHVETPLLRVGISRGIVAGCSINYDIETSMFSLDKEMQDIVSMFDGYQSLLFIELPYD